MRQNRAPATAGLASLALLSTMIAPILAAEPQPPVPGQFDSYTLAISLQDEFCVHHADKAHPECKGGHAQVHGLTLHGLWPNRDGGLCYERPVPDTAKLTLQADTLAELSAVMPSASCAAPGSKAAGPTCLPTHEWEKHGRLASTSTFLGPDAYFHTAAGLVATIRDRWTNLSALLTAAADKPFSAEALRAAIANDTGADPKILLLCDELKDPENPSVSIDFLAEIDLALSKDDLAAFPRPKSFAPAIYAYQGCDPAHPLKIHFCKADAIYVKRP